MSRRQAHLFALVLSLSLVTMNGVPNAPRAESRTARQWRDRWGIALGLYPNAAERYGLVWPPSVNELVALGAGTIWLPVSWSQRSMMNGTLASDEETVSDSDLLLVADRAHAAGLEVVICPLVEIRGGEPGAWRGRIDARAGLDWWASYERFILHYARVAERAGIEGLVLSHELAGLSIPSLDMRWRHLVRRVRAEFHGDVIAVVNHDALDTTLPWDDFDHVGVSAYFPLTDDPDANAAELDKGWARAADRLRRFSVRIGRPIVLAEIGYPSFDGAATAPWDHTLGAPVDLEEQRRCYAAFESALALMPFASGAVFWAWLGDGGPFDRWYTPRGKPAEEIMRRVLANRVRPSTRDEKT